MRYKKILISILIAILTIFFVCTNAMAMTVDDLWIDQSLSSVQSGLAEGDYSEEGITGAINTIIGLIQIAGTGISVLMVTMLGIKYILASVEEKAEIKKTAMPILIGAVLLFGAVNIVSVVESFGGKLNVF